MLFPPLPTFPYDERPEAIEWVAANISSFVPCEAEYQEGMIWI